MTFQELLQGIPGVTETVAAMPEMWPISLLQDIYAPFGALHLVGLALMGGAVLLLSLRLMGNNVTSQTLPDVERSTRPWLIAGLAIVLGTGIIIGMLNSYKLYTSVPFFAKIMALIGATIFSFGVTNVLAKAGGKASVGVLVAGGIAMAFWLLSLGTFYGDPITSAGLFHPISAGYALLVIYGMRTRWIAATVFLLLFGQLFLMYWVVGFDTYEPAFDTISYIVNVGSALLLVALYGAEIYLGRAEEATPTAKLIALFSLLAWVTVAAGGRWVGFGG